MDAAAVRSHHRHGVHHPATGEHSAHCPRPGYRPPDADWKQKPEYDQLLPGRPAAADREHL